MKNNNFVFGLVFILSLSAIVWLAVGPGEPIQNPIVIVENAAQADFKKACVDGYSKDFNNLSGDRVEYWDKDSWDHPTDDIDSRQAAGFCRVIVRRCETTEGWDKKYTVKPEITRCFVSGEIVEFYLKPNTAVASTSLRAF